VTHLRHGLPGAGKLLLDLDDGRNHSQDRALKQMVDSKQSGQYQLYWVEVEVEVEVTVTKARHVDEIERRVRGKPLRSSATSAIDGPLTRQVRNRAYLTSGARRSLENFRTRHAPGLSSIFSALTVHFTMLPPFFSAVFGDISSLRLHSLVSIRPVLLLSQLIR
jgi:hypothetical protein